jgi:hypothetical protein
VCCAAEPTGAPVAADADGVVAERAELSASAAASGGAVTHVHALGAGRFLRRPGWNTIATYAKAAVTRAAAAPPRTLKP